MDRREIILSLGLFSLLPTELFAGVDNNSRINALAKKYYSQVVDWRRHFHQYPELSNREYKTSDFVANELKELGLEVHEKIAHTGVVGILKGAKPGPTVALRADMDALPVLEKTGLAFASKETGEYEGKSVPIDHACGHDAHTAMLLGAACVLTEMKNEIAGQVMFLFQPAEEGPPKGEAGGAKLMVEEGVLDNPKVKSIFGIHVWPGITGKISYRPKGFMAAADRVEITIKGKQTHGAQPWAGTDLSAMSAQIVESINQIMSRQIDVTAEPSVLSITTIHGGERFNIIPEQYVLGGTLRTFSPERREEIIKKVTNSVDGIAKSFGATEAIVDFQATAPLTYNDPALTSALYNAMVSAAGGKDLVEPNSLAITGAEDFSEFQKKVPGLYVFLGSAAPGVNPKTLAPNHSPYFDIYEPVMEVGVRAHANAALAMLKI